jgi:hypothetical protein
MDAYFPENNVLPSVPRCPSCDYDGVGVRKWVEFNTSDWSFQCFNCKYKLKKTARFDGYEDLVIGQTRILDTLAAIQKRFDVLEKRLDVLECHPIIEEWNVRNDPDLQNVLK